MHPISLVLTAQGIDAEQYLRCAEQIGPMLGKDDIFGFGGFAATGLFPSTLLPPFREIVGKVVPFLGVSGVKRVHVWGTCFAPALAILLVLCRQYDIVLSIDSSGPQRKPLLGEWGYASWRDNSYKIAPILESCRIVDTANNNRLTCAPGTKCRGLERERHVRLTREWLAAFSQREAALYHTQHFHDQRPYNCVS